MQNKLSRYIAFFIACVLIVKEWIDVLATNSVRADDHLTRVLIDPVQIGSIAMVIVALSIFLKRNIWAYLFFIVLIASFFPAVSFSNYYLWFSMGSITIDLIVLPLLILHILLNIDLIKFPELSKKQVEESNDSRVDFFMKKFESKSDEELARMDENDLLPEAKEARKRLLEQRGV
ncbi:MAG: hypothetical protein AB8B56_21130 [Crocinitomicaceae bacterium]